MTSAHYKTTIRCLDHDLRSWFQSPEAALLSLHGGIENMVKGKLLACLQKKLAKPLLVVPEYHLGGGRRADLAILDCSNPPNPRLLTVIELKHNFVQQLSEIIGHDGSKYKKRKGRLDEALSAIRKANWKKFDLFGIQVATDRKQYPDWAYSCLKYKDVDRTAEKKQRIVRHFMMGKMDMEASQINYTTQDVEHSVRCELDVYVIAG